MVDSSFDGLADEDGERDLGDLVPACTAGAAVATGVSGAAAPAPAPASTPAAAADDARTGAKGSENDCKSSTGSVRGSGRCTSRDSSRGKSGNRGRDRGQDTSRGQKRDATDASAHEQPAKSKKHSEADSSAGAPVPAEMNETQKAEVRTENIKEDQLVSASDEQSGRGTAVRESHFGGQHTPAEKWYIVHRTPNLGLGLKLGATYPESELVRRCKGKSSKVATLKKHLQEQKYFEESTQPKKNTQANLRLKRYPSATGGAVDEVSKPKQQPASGQNASGSMVQGAKKMQFISNQVVWYTSLQPSRPARVTAVQPELDAPYLVEFLDAKSDTGRDPDKVFAKESELVAFDKDRDLARLRKTLGDDKASASQDSAPIPRLENIMPEAEQPGVDLQAGTPLWICEHRPPIPAWHATVVETTAGQKGIMIRIHRRFDSTRGANEQESDTGPLQGNTA